ncbi:cytochrome c oxidase assembly protein [Pandoraea cepalis]|uniref:Cytochrome c oxidase assembly protein CtaG n=1 Tax=Pandoraea cepalis TaxID=2508294 RepID=A0AAW7MSG2_9BURK|nr:cytochrome c oxidase assembly protein [Pandoraea cepalis]MDN4575782.1 cytochrome c oxidase assembly protein [Pandoraea cepalis]MDN4580884.1 cytochrome c oxidase assembly protein [Pandoraea cepalis]
MSGLRRINVRTFSKLLLMVVVMFGFGYAMVPFYRAFCNLVGINQLGDRATEITARNSQVDESRTITVEFDANAQGPLRFKPAKSSLTVHPGQIATIEYEVANQQSHEVRAQAIPSYAPALAASYFKKIECFCFTQQTLKAGEAKEYPVVFVVDTKLPKDVNTITLSYTFFDLGKNDASPRADTATGTQSGELNAGPTGGGKGSNG